MQKKEIDTLFIIVRAGLGTPFQDEHLSLPCGVDWNQLFRLIQQQGVLAIAWDGLSNLLKKGVNLDLPRTQKLKWGVNSEIVAERYNKQWEVATDFAKRLYNDNIQTIVLKGFALSELYPIPSHRPCGDLDCFLMENKYEAGNIAAESYGATVKRDFYVHSHIEYKGLIIENHQFCTPIRGNEKAKTFERTLQGVLQEVSPHPINGSHLLSPSPLFTALHLAHHTRRHFIAEGIALRHLIDWAMLVKHHGEAIDWMRFLDIIREYDPKLIVFAEALMQITSKFFNTPYIELDKTLSENLINEMMADTLNESANINTNNYGVWKKRWIIISNYYSRYKLYKHFNEGSISKVMLRLIRGYIFDHSPKL